MSRPPAARNLSLLIGMLLSGCAVGPQFVRPDPPAGVATTLRFHQSSQPGLAEADVPQAFWRRFDDPQLDALIAAALRENHDLRIARSSLQAARALHWLSTHDRWPTVTASASQAEFLASENAAPGVGRAGRERSAVDVGFDAFWELDLFGRTRRGIEIAGAEVRGGEATVQDAQVSLSAEVARIYLQLRGLQEQLGVAQRNLLNQRSTLEITRTRLQAGRGNRLDSARALAQLSTTAAGIPLLESGIAASMHRLAILTGRTPEALVAQLGAASALPSLPVLSIDTPEALLRRRPDIRIAEHQLAAATARIGLAMADLFPRVTLVGSVGWSADSISSLGDSAAETYTFGPSIQWAAFDLGRVRARIVASEHRAEAALAHYELTVLRALEETETALVAYGRAQQRRDALAEAAAASTDAAALARQRFDGGLTDFLDVLDAERSALSAQDQLAQARTAAATALVALYKALGGGWSVHTTEHAGADSVASDRHTKG
jgi:multidrug efflux system outer membrane protein